MQYVYGNPGHVLLNSPGDPFRALRETEGMAIAENLREAKREASAATELSERVVNTDNLRESEGVVSSEKSHLRETEVVFSAESLRETESSDVMRETRVVFGGEGLRETKRDGLTTPVPQNLRETEGVSGAERFLPETERVESADRRWWCCWCSSCREALTICRPHAWKIATSLATAASALFWAAIALAELEDTVWKVCLVLVGIIWVGAVLAALYACKRKCAELRSSGDQENLAPNVAPFV